jgi:hypothetical protein
MEQAKKSLVKTKGRQKSVPQKPEMKKIWAHPEHTPLGRIETKSGERALLAQRLDLVDELVATIVASAGQT